MFDFLTEEQRQLSDLVRRFVERDYEFETRGRVLDSPDGMDADLSATLAKARHLENNVDKSGHAAGLFFWK